MEKLKIIMLSCYSLIFIVLVVAAVLSVLELWIFKPYERKYAPPHISTGQNKSPYTLK